MISLNTNLSNIEHQLKEIIGKLDKKPDLTVDAPKFDLNINPKQIELKPIVSENKLESYKVDRIEVGKEIISSSNSNFEINTFHDNQYKYKLTFEGFRVKGFYDITLEVANIEGKKQSEEVYYKTEEISQVPGILKIENGIITEIIKLLEIKFL